MKTPNKYFSYLLIHMAVCRTARLNTNSWPEVATTPLLILCMRYKIYLKKTLAHIVREVFSKTKETYFWMRPLFTVKWFQLVSCIIERLAPFTDIPNPKRLSNYMIDSKVTSKWWLASGQILPYGEVSAGRVCYQRGFPVQFRKFCCV